jgi:hypothetical protein
MLNGKKHIFNHTTVIGSETSEMENIDIPPKEFGGFLEFPAADFQHHIHELFQTATVVSFATNMKDFRMITQGTANGGQFSPRQIIFYPSVDGVKFMDKNPQFMKKNKDKIDVDEEDSECVFVSPTEDIKDNEEEEVESPFMVDRLTVGGNEEDSEKEDENSDEEDYREKPINISKMLNDTCQELGDDYITATYMLKYINSFTKATQLSKKVVILFQHGGPLILHYQIEKGVITYCLSDISSAAEQNRG